MIKVDKDLHISDLAKTVLENPKPDDFVSFLALRTLSTLECRGVILGKIQNEGFLDLIASYGYESKRTDQFDRMPLWTPLPITDAARFGKILEFKTPADLVKAYPHLAPVAILDNTISITAPIYKGNIVIGALGFTCLIQPTDNLSDDPIAKSIFSLCGIYLQLQALNNSLNFKHPVNNNLSAKLSERQLKIINLFKDELTTTQMANRLKYSHSTIKQDILRIYHIFECSSRQEVLNRAYASGIIEK